MKLSKKHIAYLVDEGFEDLEFWVPLMRLQEEGARVTIVASKIKTFHGKACLEATPECLYDRNWAVAVLEEALKRLQAEFKASGRGPLFEQLQPYLQGDVSGPSYAEVAERLGTTKGTIRVTVHRLRERYRTLLRTVVNQTVNGPVETDLELAHLMTALRG